MVAPCGNLKLSQKYILDRSLTKAGLFRIIPNEHQVTKRSNLDQQSDMLLVWLHKKSQQNDALYQDKNLQALRFISPPKTSLMKLICW